MMLNADNRPQWFSGRLTYHNTFKALPPDGFWQRVSQYVGYDGLGKAVVAMRAMIGAETKYYISGNNYRSYGDATQPVQLYVGDTNKYYSFLHGRALPALDASVNNADVVITPLPQTEMIAGYFCQSLQVVSGSTTTVYFYSHKVCVDPAHFLRHKYGNWAVYLAATHGALPMRFTIRNTSQGYEWTSEATSVESMPLTPADFTVDAPPR